MSYILEALKKIEQKKEREEAPKSIIFGGNVTETARKHAVWPYVLIAVLLINAALVLRWGLSPSPPRKSPAAVPAAVSQGTSQPPTPMAAVERSGTGETPGPARRVDKSKVRRSSPYSEPPRPATVGDAQGLSASGQGASVAVVPPAKPIHQTEKPVAVSGRIYDLGELPEEIRSALPEFRISGHAYSSEPQTRVVRINEKILQEGQDLSPGLRVEEIVPTGVVLSYRGYRFRVGIGQSRS